MVARIQISYILSRCATAENTVLMTLGFALSQLALYFCCSTPGQDITNTSKLCLKDGLGVGLLHTDETKHRISTSIWSHQKSRLKSVCTSHLVSLYYSHLQAVKPVWKTTCLEDHLSGRPPDWKTTCLEDYLSGRTTVGWSRNHFIVTLLHL